MNQNKVVTLAIPVPLRKLFHYTVPSHLESVIQVGQRVWVDFGRRGTVGYVVEYPGQAPQGVTLKTLSKIMDGSRPTFSTEMVDFLLWMAQYYQAPPGEVFRSAHPAGTNNRSIPGLALGPNSSQIPLDLDGDHELRTILDFLQNQGGPRPIKEIPISINQNRLRTWLKRGLLVRVPIVVDARVDSKRIRTYRAIRMAPKTPRGPGGRTLKRDTILEWLSGRDKVPSADIVAAFPNAKSHLKHLVDEGSVLVEDVEVRRDPFALETIVPDVPPLLNSDQASAVRLINQARGYQGFLLHGITGSGKTEVYLGAIQHVLSQDKKALVLVPEISLTPQLVRRFRARLGDCIAVLHSGLSEGERFDEWRRIQEGMASVVIGARSAIFAPIRELGIIIVDEEHDGSFKQGDKVRYHGRDMALVRGYREKVPVVLGSATPSLESVYNAQKGKLSLINLPVRATGGHLPQVELIDLKTTQTPEDGYQFLSHPVRDAIAGSLAKGEQSIIFLNRRGFSSCVLCSSCGEVIDCHRCAISMTWHKSRQRLHCHYCDAARPLPATCDACKQPSLTMPGRGTERIEECLNTLFPQARIRRLDRDTSGTRRLNDVIEGMRNRTIDILVGTQMVTKGHDFPYVTTVAILDADAGLNFPDFRAGERTFQLLTQVAGRAGRAHRPGRVYVQTYDPSHYVLQALLSHNHIAFCAAELELRKQANYPPFAHAVTVRVDGKNPTEVQETIGQYAQKLRTSANDRAVTILGPAPAALERIRGRTRWALLAMGRDRSHLHALFSRLDLSKKQTTDVRVSVDVDPYDLL